MSTINSAREYSHGTALTWKPLPDAVANLEVPPSVWADASFGDFQVVSEETGERKIIIGVDIFNRITDTEVIEWIINNPGIEIFCDRIFLAATNYKGGCAGYVKFLGFGTGRRTSPDTLKNTQPKQYKRRRTMKGW